MALCVCELCGEAFGGIGSTVCPKCEKDLDMAYSKVKKYIYQNSKDVKFSNIIEDTGVSEKQLNQLISQGRVILGSKANASQKCKVCGREAKDGMLCESCKAKLSSEKFFSKPSSPKPEDSPQLKKGVKPLLKNR